jgi:predicted restriction endonuclease
LKVETIIIPFRLIPIFLCFNLVQSPIDEYTDELIDLPVESLEEITLDRENIESKLDFNPENLTDARERTNRAIVQRQGQSKFRSELLKAYGGQCAITDCDAEAALEAAHIFPYLGTDTNHVKNGLLLRADIHTLFDLHLISIDPNTSKVVISSSVLNTCYKELNGKPLKSPKDYASPSPEAIARHYQIFLLKQNDSLTANPTL